MSLTGDDGDDDIRMRSRDRNRVRGEVWGEENDLAANVRLCEGVLQQNDHFSCVFLPGFLCLLASHSHSCS